MREFTSGFSADLNGMIDFKIALHYAESTFMERSRQFDMFCAKSYPKATVVTEGLAISWLRIDENASPGVIHARAAFLRGFARYQKAIGKNAYILPDAYISGKRAFIPYLFTDEELSALFSRIDAYECKTNLLRSWQYKTYFRLTYTCGLRPGEGRALKRKDVDLKTGEVRILNTKWHKSRTVVMSDDMLSLSKEYGVMRDAVFSNEDYFFPQKQNEPFGAAKMQAKFRLFFAQSQPDIPEDLLPAVRVYDLRHRFATTVLNKWLDEKRNLSSRLPYLQTYMGHKDLAATAYYIHLLPEQLVKNSGIDWDSMNDLLPRCELWEK